MFKHEPCSCGEGFCAKGVIPETDCVNRLQGVVEAARCEKCQGDTLHHNGECIRCLRVATSPKEPIGSNTTPSRESPPVSKSTLTLSITLGGTPILVTDKSRVREIVKILLED
jgi:hypothetical protein